MRSDHRLLGNNGVPNLCTRSDVGSRQNDGSFQIRARIDARPCEIVSEPSLDPLERGADASLRRAGSAMGKGHGPQGTTRRSPRHHLATSP